MRWIPPFGLIAGHAAQGASWLILLWAASSGQTALGPASLAWIHAVALGWLSVVSVSIMIHVVPAFTRSKWRDPLAARSAVFLTILASLTVVAGFAAWRPDVAWIGGAVVAAAVLWYLACVVRAVRGALVEGPGPRRVVAIGFLAALVVFALTAVLGTLLALALAGWGGPALLERTPAVHGHLGILLWMSVLILGVSVRTFNPIFGAPQDDLAAHRRVSSAFALGSLLLIVGLAADSTALAAVGGAVAAFGAVLFALQTFTAAARATVPYRVPQIFAVSSAVWLLAAVVLGFGTLAGMPWSAAYLYAGLIGWIGMMVVAHVHHIGVRLMLTVRLGEDDETRPGEVLVPALSWVTLAAYEAAVVAGVAGGLGMEGGWIAAGALGFAGWIGTTVNVVAASFRAGRLTGATTS